jgi:hypothetical protein
MPRPTSSPPSEPASPLRLSLTLLLPLLAALPGCSLFFTEGDPFPDEVEEADPEFSGPQSFAEEFPYVRITELDVDRYQAVLTAPVDSGDGIKAVLLANCSFLRDKAAPPPAPPAEGEAAPLDPATATVEVIAKGGKVFNAKADQAQQPWSEKGAFVDIEDLIVLEGSEVDLRECFRTIDIWYNNGPQIEIQAAVLETIISDDFERGVVAVSGQPIFQKTDGKTFLRAIGGSFPTAGNPAITGGGLGGVAEVGLIDSVFQLDAAIQALQARNLADVVSRPSIVTRNGVPANLESIEQIPFLNVTSVTLSGAAAFNIGTKDVGVKLRVTPFQVGIDTIHLVIFVEVSRLGQEFVIGTDGNNQQITSPSLNTRRATTEVYVRNGQTVAIGGLKLREERVVTSKVPFLGDLPGIGWLFSSRREEDNESNVTFFITPNLKKRASIEPIGDFFDPFTEAGASEE